MDSQANPQSSRASDELSFDAACSLVEAALAGPLRRDIVAEMSRARDLRHALRRLRDAIQSNVWHAGSGQIRLDRFVPHYDRRTRKDGFHALHDWDGKADTVNENTIPIDVLDYIAD